MEKSLAPLSPNELSSRSDAAYRATGKFLEKNTNAQCFLCSEKINVDEERFFVFGCGHAACCQNCWTDKLKNNLTYPKCPTCPECPTQVEDDFLMKIETFNEQTKINAPLNGCLVRLQWAILDVWCYLGFTCAPSNLRN